MPPASIGLFAADLTEGFHYGNEFISAEKEAGLAEQIGRLEFSAFEMRGVVARRRVAFLGASYDAAGTDTPPIPAFLLPLRERTARWANVDADAFAMALVNEYRSGAPIGWHRDAPQYNIVAGISLLAACRMKFRPYVRPAARPGATGLRTATHEVVL